MGVFRPYFLISVRSMRDDDSFLSVMIKTMPATMGSSFLKSFPLQQSHIPFEDSSSSSSSPHHVSRNRDFGV